MRNFEVDRRRGVESTATIFSIACYLDLRWLSMEGLTSPCSWRNLAFTHGIR